jgi:hypothetical protein
LHSKYLCNQDDETKGHVAHLKEIRNAFKVCLEIVKERYPVGDLCTAGRIVLKQIIEKKVGG